MGFVALAAGIGLSFVIISTEASRAWRLIVFFPFWMAGLGMLQSRARVCIALAAQSVRNMDADQEKITDHSLAEQLKKKAREINRQALVTAGVITLVVVLFPSKLV